MNALTYLITSVEMERLKINRTLIVWLSLFAPAFVVVVTFMAGYTNGEKFYQPEVNPWINFCEHLLAGWSLFIFPLYVSLLSALYAALEHQNRAWGYVYSLPVPKSSIYLSKLFVLSALIALSHVLLVFFGLGAGWLLGQLKPAYGFQDFTIPAFMPLACMNLFVGGLGVIVIQLLISLWYPGFIIPAGVGLFATLASAIARTLPVSHFSPYLWPFAFLANTLQVNHWNYTILGWSVSVYVLGAMISLLLLGRRSHV
ncbi:ABC transporter permease [Spirosoma gilvum]